MSDDPVAASTDPAVSAEEQEPAQAGLWERFKRLNHLQLLAGILGAVGLVLGAIVAWQSESATTLLIVSAVLLVLAALGLDWHEIRGSYGPATFELFRQKVEASVDQAADRAADESDPDQLRAEFETLRAEVKSLSPPPTPPRRTETRFYGGGTGGPIDKTIRELFRTKASHSFRGRDAAVLSLRTAAKERGYVCTVKTPGGASYSADVGVAGTLGIGNPTYSVAYPNDFNGSEPFVPGRYEIEWRDKSDPGASTVLPDLLAQLITPPVATDSFTIPDLSAPAKKA